MVRGLRPEVAYLSGKNQALTGDDLVTPDLSGQLALQRTRISTWRKALGDRPKGVTGLNCVEQAVTYRSPDPGGTGGGEGSPPGSAPGQGEDDHQYSHSGREKNASSPTSGRSGAKHRGRAPGALWTHLMRARGAIGQIYDRARTEDARKRFGAPA